MNNLYVHFPFCRRKCTYCSLYSRVGSTPAVRADYIRRLVSSFRASSFLLHPSSFKTVYFGGGSPALCDLKPLADALRPSTSSPQTEFTVELHPLDVTEDKLLELADLGVNRISMGVQSLDDRVLEHMGRGYTASDAARAFAQVKRHFDNAGIDLIVGYPAPVAVAPDWSALAAWGLKHCSVYSLQNERHLKGVPSDEWMLDRIREAEAALSSMGLRRYEISNYAVPGFECRHNLAVWRGEDYLGLGEGAFGRLGLTRTFNGKVTETLLPEKDEVERTIFRLRTFEGLDASRHSEWLSSLNRFVSEGLLFADGTTYFLTARGREVCDTILAELV